MLLRRGSLYTQQPQRRSRRHMAKYRRLGAAYLRPRASMTPEEFNGALR